MKTPTHKTYLGLTSNLCKGHWDFAVILTNDIVSGENVRWRMGEAVCSLGTREGARLRGTLSSVPASLTAGP